MVVIFMLTSWTHLKLYKFKIWKFIYYQHKNASKRHLNGLNGYHRAQDSPKKLFVHFFRVSCGAPITSLIAVWCLLIRHFVPAWYWANAGQHWASTKCLMGSVFHLIYHISLNWCLNIWNIWINNLIWPLSRMWWLHAMANILLLSSSSTPGISEHLS